MFNPAQPYLLYASQRRSDELLCWDVRSPFEVMRKFKRRGMGTNQKMSFDIDPAGRWLVSGDEVYIIFFFATRFTQSFQPVKTNFVRLTPLIERFYIFV